MHKILISVFDSEAAAYKGLDALKDLHREGDITLYASEVIAKDETGVPHTLRADDRGPIGTLTGVVAGSLVGLLGGPVGVAVGAYVGGVGGLAYDLFNTGVGYDFVGEVETALTPGKVAIVADIDETWMTPIETALGPLGATTLRRLPGDWLDEELERDAEATKAELAQLMAEARQTSGDAKARIEAAIEAQRRKVHSLGERIDKAIAQQKSDFESRLATLKAQRDAARERQREQIDARIAELHASNEARHAKLQRARELNKEARELTREALKP